MQLKYSKETGNITINCKNLKNKYLVEIEDSGIGIKKEISIEFLNDFIASTETGPEKKEERD